jgi:hypothetical protein
MFGKMVCAILTAFWAVVLKWKEMCIAIVTYVVSTTASRMVFYGGNFGL